MPIGRLVTVDVIVISRVFTRFPIINQEREKVLWGFRLTTSAKIQTLSYRDHLSMLYVENLDFRLELGAC